MPLHEYECQACGNEFEQLRNYGDIVSVAPCPKCHSFSKKVWNAPVIHPDQEPRYNEQLGEYVRSRQHEKEICKQIYERTEGRTSVDWH